MFEPISRILNKRAGNFSFKREILAVEICKMWPKIIEQLFDKSIAESTQALSFKEGVLVVKIPNSVLMQELQIEKENIIASINKEAKKKIVENINYKL
jgi:predicted nucleic acid-binding Zn ribbon protein